MKNSKLTLFSNDELRPYRWNIFLQSELGKLYQAIPFNQLASLVPSKVHFAGAPGWFKAEGMFGLMFLKSYLNLSDAKLIARLNADWEMQLFCGIHLSDNQRIRDKDIVSRTRLYIFEHVSFEAIQEVLLAHWKPHMNNTQCLLIDATVYESYIKYPTDVKLLWDCVVWIYESLHLFCKELRVRRPRSKYKEQQEKQTNYQKTRKKTYKLTHRRKRTLLQLLDKGIGQLEGLIEKYEIQAKPSFYDRLKVVKTILRQQQQLFTTPKESVGDRIVSLFKPYLRPIVRGKENKPVEFGMKVHIAQVDGVNFIDKLSFDPYNESVYLAQSVINHKKRFGTCHQLGADKIYGTNKNRRYLKGQGIYHSLSRKGKPSRYEQQEKLLRKQLGIERSTVLEGSFGNEKNHYSLRKVKARTQATEIVWVIFGIMTANAVRMGKRIANKNTDYQKAA